MCQIRPSAFFNRFEPEKRLQKVGSLNAVVNENKSLGLKSGVMTQFNAFCYSTVHFMNKSVFHDFFVNGKSLNCVICLRKAHSIQLKRTPEVRVRFPDLLVFTAHDKFNFSNTYMKCI